MIKPNGNRILVKLNEEVNKEIGGILIPSDNQQTPPREGLVIEIGDMVDEIKVDDTVIISKSGGTPIEIDGIEYVIVDIDDVVGILKNA